MNSGAPVRKSIDFDRSLLEYLGCVLKDEETSGTVITLEQPFDPARHREAVEGRLLFGNFRHNQSGPRLQPPIPLQPDYTSNEYNYYPSECFEHIYPQTPPLLIPPPTPEPPPSRCFPVAPTEGYQLQPDRRFTRGFIYSANYDLSRADHHRQRLIAVAAPPNIRATRSPNGTYSAEPVAGMVPLQPGIPFVVKLDGDSDRVQTIGCVQTLESLRIYPDYPEIWEASVRLAKLTWGTDVIPPVFTLYGLKRNDRSEARSALHTDDHDGSYNLANTVMKGDGLGTLLPAVQVNTPNASSQIKTILAVLHRLYRLILPKCVSKFEFDILEFHAKYSNIFAFGGLDPNGTSVQMNVSSCGKNLLEAIGRVQGMLHADGGDDFVQFSHFILLFRLGPTADPGAFCLARGGLYIRAINAWIVFLVFKGVDLHGGFEPLEDPKEHEEWVRSVLDPAWQLAGPQNRVGYVNYPSRIAAERSGSLNATPATGFGNYGSNATKKVDEQTFASHGLQTLGSPRDFANRMGREALADFFNSLQFSNLTLNMDLNVIAKAISYTDTSTGETISMDPLPYNPQTEGAIIRQLQGYYFWHFTECNLYYRRITKNDLSRYSRWVEEHQNANRTHRSRLLKITPLQPPDGDEQLEISDVISVKIDGSKRVYVVQLAGDPANYYEISSSSPRISNSQELLKWATSNDQVPETLRSRYGNSGGMHQILHGPLQSTSDTYNSSHTSQAAPDPLQPQPTIPGLAVGSADAPSLRSGPERITRIALPTITAKPSSRRKSPSVPTTKTASRSSTSAARKHPTRHQSQSTLPGSKKRKASAPEPDDLDDDATEAKRKQGPAYEVESIIEHKFDHKKKTYRFRLRWKGYEPEHDTWASLSQMPNCVEVLGDYTRINEIDLFGKEGPDSGAMIPDGMQDVDSERAGLLAAGYARLCDMLDARKLSEELSSLQAAFDTQMLAPRSEWKLATHKDWASGLMVHARDIEYLRSLLPLMGSETPAADLIRFDLVYRTTLRLPKLQQLDLQLDILRRSNMKMICMTWTTIYDWYSLSQDRLLTKLMRIHCENGPAALLEQFDLVSSLVDHVIRFLLLKIYFSLDATISDLRAKSLRIEKRLHTAHSKTLQLLQRPSLIPSLPVPDNTNPSMYANANWETLEVPYDMYGLLPSVDGTLKRKSKVRKFRPKEGWGSLVSGLVEEIDEDEIEIESEDEGEGEGEGNKDNDGDENDTDPDDMPSESDHKANKRKPRTKKAGGFFNWQKDNVEKFVYRVGAEAVGGLWSATVIMPQLRLADRAYAGQRGQKFKRMSNEDILDRAMARGAILTCISEVCGGPAIFSSPHFTSMMRSPTLFFSGSRRKPSGFARGLRRDAEKLLTPFVNSLLALLNEKPEIMQIADAIDSITQRFLFGFLNGGLDPEDLDFDDEAANKRHSRTIKSGPGAFRLFHLDIGSVLPQATDGQAHLTSIGLILREAVNHSRSLPPGDSRIARIMAGEHPALSSGASNRNPDQTNPLRHASDYARLVHEFLPPTLLTSKHGLSSLLSFMGTGQGSGTISFLSTVRSREKRFCCSSVEEVVDVFETALAANGNLMTKKRDKRSGHIVCYDIQIWGTANDLLSLCPSPKSSNKTRSKIPPNSTKSDLLHIKFGPYWTTEVQKAWTALLGDLVDEDPTTSIHRRPSWSQTLSTINSLNIPLFKSGLTVFQAANNLALANICMMPTCKELAHWISRNGRLGAIRGLEHLGFATATEGQILVGIECILAHMRTHLSETDQHILNPGALFVEHVLCKVSRFAHRLNQASSVDESDAFRECEQQAEIWERQHPWQRGINESTPNAFPFPLIMPRADVERVIARLKGM